MIITISGLNGSGKSTVGKLIAKELGYKFYSMGDLRGETAKEMGMTLDEFNKLGETESWTDTKVDDYQKNLGETSDNFVADGRLSFHFIPHSIKIFMDVSPEEAAKRMMQDQANQNRSDEKHYNSLAEAVETFKARTESDSLRYKTHYKGLDYLDMSHYDLVLDTSQMTIEEVKDKILKFIAKKK